MKLLSGGGFRLTKFASNSRELLASTPPASRANLKLDLDLDRLPLERALAVYWDAQSDTFKFKVLQANKPSTKRGVFSVVGSLFSAKTLTRAVEAEVVLGRRNPRVVFFPVAEVVRRATVCCYNRNTKVLQNLLPRDGSRGITIQHVKPGCR